MKPLLFMPSPRSIPDVTNSWQYLPYDKYIVKNRLEKQAYQNGRDFFMDHDEYTHLVICPDDIIVDYDSMEILRRDVEEYEFNNICGVGMVDEESTAFCCKPLGTPFDATGVGSYYYKINDKLRDNCEVIPNEITQVGFTGFMIQWLDRELVKKLSFEGGCEDGKGCMDIKMSEEMEKLEIPYIIEPHAFFTHLRFEQKRELKKWLKNGDHKGYTVHVTI